MANANTTPEVTFAVEEITPAIAEEMLTRNTHNRRISERNVVKYANQMRDGLWRFDGAPIRFNDKDELRDGQHRLMAIVASGVSQKMIVVRNLDDITMATIDTGKSRTFADILSLNDKTLVNHIALAAATALIYRWEDGRRGNALRSSGTQNAIPYSLLMAFFKENRELLVEYTREAGRLLPLSGINGSIWALCLWLFNRISPDDASDFFERVHDGIGLEEGSPILTLRNWMAKTYAIRPRPTPEMQVAVMIKAWNSYRIGEELHALGWRRGGAAPEAFPEPI